MNIIKKQTGATLFTSLMILLAITILGITAARVSTIDVLVASNEQQRMLVYQKAESVLSDFVSTANLNNWNENGSVVEFDADQSVEYTENGLYNINANIQQLNDYYQCVNPDGSATSIGIHASCCHIYDFQVTVSRQGSSTLETHYRGAGKEQPCAQQ